MSVDVAWMARAACRGLWYSGQAERFFTEDQHLQATAFEVCGRCPVKWECLEYALADPELKGVWGGTSERERRRIRRARRRIRPPEASSPPPARCPGCSAQTLVAAPSGGLECLACGLTA